VVSAPASTYLAPIEAEIRRVRALLGDAEWRSDERDATRYRSILLSLLAAQARGERYAIPF
jgi:hypothetical protein